MDGNLYKMTGGLLVPTSFGYNATVDKGRRQAPQTRVRHESDILDKRKRERLQATAQDQARNHALVAWMVRKHLDYVSKFHMSFRTEYPDLNTLVNRIFKWHGRPGNLDFGGRFGRDEFFRLFELEKVLSGDAGLIKLPDLKLQALESDLIAKGEGAPDGVSDDGLIVNEYGHVTDYAICTRPKTKTNRKPIFDHLEPRDNVIFDAYWTRFSSQFRGVSPLSVAINTIQDIHEGFEFNQVKMKMHALFGVAITRKQAEGEWGGAGGSAEETTGASTGPTDDPTGVAHDLNPRTINMLDLDIGEDVKVIESGTPSNEFVQGSYLFIQVAMLALDIPVTCFDSRRSNFSARIADLNEYEVSSDAKRTKNRYVRQSYSDWVIDTIWNDPDSDWPLRRVAARHGIDKRKIQEAIEWVPSGSPWLDKYKQIQGDQLGIDLCLDNAIDAARRRGGNVFENIDKQKKVIEYARSQGVPIGGGKAGSRSIEEIIHDEVESTIEERNEETDDE